MYENRRNYGDSSVILNSIELLTENPATLVVGGSVVYNLSVLVDLPLSNEDSKFGSKVENIIIGGEKL